MAPMTFFENSHYVPIYCDLRDKKVVVAGGGQVAERKVRALLTSGAKIVIISPDVTDGLRQIIRQKKVQHLKRPFEQGDLENAWLVIAATDDRNVQELVFQEAQEQRCFCNVVDEPDRCSFIVPSQVKRGALSISISTGGQSPALSKALRKKLEEQFGNEWALYVEIIGKLRRFILENIPPEDVSAKLKRLVCMECLEWIRNKEWEKLCLWATDICGHAGEQIVREVIS